MTKAEYVMFKQAEKSFKEHVKGLIPGAAAGAASTLAVMPIDAISDAQKYWSAAENAPNLNRVGKSFISTAKELYNPKVRTLTEHMPHGIKAFYTGIGGKLSKTVPAMAITYAVANSLTKKLEKPQ